MLRSDKSLQTRQKNYDIDLMPTVPLAVQHDKLFNIGLVYGHYVYRFRWLIIGIWGVILAVSIPFAASVPTLLHNSGYSITGSDSNEVDHLLVDKLHRPATQILVVFQSETTSVSNPAYQKQVKTFIDRVKHFTHVSGVVQGGVGNDGRTTFVMVGFDQNQDLAAQHIPDLRALLPDGGSTNSLLPNGGTTQLVHASLTGDAVVSFEIQQDTQSGIEAAESIALPLALLVLLIVFGTLVAALMPILLAGVTLVVALALVYAIAVHVETNIFVLNVASVIGLGISIDYSLFITRRFREELIRGRSISDTLSFTLATAGEAILFSGTTVAIGFIGLLFIGIAITTSFGIGGIAVALSAVVATLTLLPALLAVLGPRINSLAVSSLLNRFRKTPRQQNARGGNGFWASWALQVMRRPVVIIIACVALLLLLAWPTLTLNPGLPGTSALPKDSEAQLSLKQIQTQFPTLNTNPVFIVVQTSDGSSITTSQNIRRVNDFTHWVSTQAHVSSVIGLMAPPRTAGQVQPNQQLLLGLYSSGLYRNVPALAALSDATTNGDTTLLTLQVDTLPGSNADQVLLDHLRGPFAPQGLQAHVGGPRALTLDFDRSLYTNFGWTLVFILGATYLLLLLMFRSLLLPLKAILMNILSIGVAFGALVFVFQEGHFQDILNFSSEGIIDRFVPLILFCVLFGLSMDYEVFLLSRIREEWVRTGNNRLAVANGLQKTAGIITNAAILLVIVSGAFTFTPLIITKELGFGLTIAVLVDATIIRTILVPATMQLMGRWNWWLPGVRQKRVL